MDAFKEELLRLLGEDVWQYALMTSEEICFDPEVRQACERNYCGKYGKCWTCPPGVGEPEALKAEILTYKNVFLFTTKHDIEDSFDVEGMADAHKRHDEVTRRLFYLCARNGAKLLAAGGCSLCEKCSYPDAPCRQPDKALTSVEACGINVMETSRRAGINYINGANTVTYFTAVLFN